MARPSRPPSRLRRALRIAADPASTGPVALALFLVALLLAELPIALGRSLSTSVVPGGEVVGAWLIASGAILLAQLTYLRTSTAKRHPALTVMTFAAAVLVGFLVSGVVEQRLTASEVGPTGASVFVHTVYGTLALLVISVASGHIREHRALVGSLQATRASLIGVRQAAESAVASERATVLARVTRELRAALQQLDPSERDGSARALRAAATEMVRPLSHELASHPAQIEVTIAPQAPPRWSQLFAEVVREPLIAPKAMATTATVLAFSLTVTSGPVPAAAGSSATAHAGPASVSVSVGQLAVALTQLAAVYLATWLMARALAHATRRVLPRVRTSARWGVAALSAVAVAVGAQVVVAVTSLLPGFPARQVPDAAGWLSLSLPLMAVSAVVAITRAVSARRRVAVTELEEANATLTWEAARARDTLWCQRQEIAHLLHGPTQAALTAGSLRLLMDSSTADATSVLSTVRQQVEEVLARLADPAPRPMDLVVELERLQRTWQGACQINFSIHPSVREELLQDPYCTTICWHVITEAVANAVVHGQATHADVVIEPAGERLVRLQVRDNGRSPEVAGEPGLGSLLLDQVAVSWQVTADSGLTLRATLPLAAVEGDRAITAR